MRASLLAATWCLGCSMLPAAAEQFHIGRTPTAQELAGWNIDVRADGQGLPAGRGSVKDGQKIYDSLCAGCHGVHGEGGAMDRLAGGEGSLHSEDPVRTVGSYWPYATTLFDYVRRAMPLNAPQSLSADQVYAVSAYILYLNQILPADAVLDQNNLATILMPNRNGFTSPDPRPDTQNSICLQNCRPY